MKYHLSKKQVYSHLPKPFYFMTTCDMNEYTNDKVKENLLELKNCGFGGFILFNKPPKGFNESNYLSEDWFTMVKLFAINAKKLKLEMWINDGFDYPPGNVGGKLFKINQNLPQLHLVLEDGKPVVKQAGWGYPAFENPESGKLFNKLVHEEYKKHVGEFFGNPIKGFFTDGDNRRVQPGAMLNENHQCRDYFPWAVDFEKSFSEIYGYDIMPFMKEVMERKDIPQAVDYWDHAGRMYRRWFENNKKWLHENNLLYTGHTGDTSPYLYKDAPRGSSFTESRFSDIQSIFDFPGTDQELLAIDGGKHMVAHNWYAPKAIWGNEIHTPRMTNYSDISQDLRAKQAGSTAFIYDKKEVMCEMFAASNYNVSPAELKQIAAYQIMQGVTFIVEHAFHYRFFGQTKYFAPPEFSSKGMIGEYVKDLNTELAEISYMMSAGKSVCPVALLDPTEGTWRNNYDYKPYFKAFTDLNRLPYGFAICDIDKILSGKLGFKAVVIEGFTPNAEKVQRLKDMGIVVLDGNSLDKLEGVVNCGISYKGTGTPHFVRKNINGQEFTFIANIENEEPITGVLSAYGREKEVVLYQGDIRYFSAKYDDFPEIKTHGEKVFAIPDEVPVKFASKNRLAIERFEHGDNAYVKTDNQKEISFPFETTEEILDAVLYMPEDCVNKCTSITIDGKEYDKNNCKVYDERYVFFKLPLLSTGKHSIDIIRNEPFNYYDVLFLEGTFDVKIASDKTEYKNIFSDYNLSVFIPKNAAVVLSKRRNTLKTDCSWALQGQPFYSGITTYSFTAEIPENGKYRLVIPKVRDVVKVYINNKLIDKVIKYPYEFEFKGKKGSLSVKIEVANSLGNAMEFYLEESGLLSGGYIEKA